MLLGCGMNMPHGTLIAEASDGQGGKDVEAARGVTQANGDTAHTVGVGPRLDTGERCERAELLCPGALRSADLSTAEHTDRVVSDAGTGGAR